MFLKTHLCNARSAFLMYFGCPTRIVALYEALEMYEYNPERLDNILNYQASTESFLEMGHPYGVKVDGPVD